MIYRFRVRCPQCNGDLEHNASGRDPICSRAVVSCSDCGTFLIEVTIRREATATYSELRRKAQRDRMPA